ncbi:hypothetical protein [Blastopirellula marina]|uniref:Uncharacterized protein n=1 Tax=Blastopirellula marina DSM 3645 TaxID=314230 RepID=A3ZUJ4_9BACT|nr:hypothetical protein [Blastopirellula marina]EAQ79904.1 hypothetical protein DSM3645_22229 [Blastopirellula marina DSM 3645]
MSIRIFACLLLLLASLPAVAAEPEKSTESNPAVVATATAKSAETDRTIRRAIRQLDSDTFAERREAAEQLRDAGPAAIASLEEACRDGAGERVAQSIEILQSFAASEDREVSAAALHALKNIADGENATAAKLAATAVHSIRTTPGMRPAPEAGGDRIAGFNPFDNAMLQGMRGRERNFSMSTVRNNGREQIKITDGERRVEIDKDPSGPLRVEWREGNDAPQVAEADDLDQLRKDHPQAAEIYDQYQAQIAGAQGMLGERFFAPLRLDGLPIPQPMRQMDEQWARMRAEHQQMMEEMRAQHQQRMRNMRQIAPARPANPPTQLRRLQEDARQLQQRIQAGDVDDATIEEISRLQELLKELQRQANQ